jgi:hypothetical protein
MHTNAADYRADARFDVLLRRNLMAQARRFLLSGSTDLATFALRHARIANKRARFFNVRASMLDQLPVL